MQLLSHSCVRRLSGRVLPRKGASKLVSAGMQLKKDASAFVESIKEDAEDAAAEAEYRAAQSAPSAN